MATRVENSVPKVLWPRIVLSVCAWMFWIAPALGAMERYEVDLDHSTLEFSVAHMVVSKTTGRFTDYSGFIEMDPEAKKANSIEAVIKTASVTTNHAKRDEHLRGAEFFNVEQYPTMIYKMKSYQKTG